MDEWNKFHEKFYLCHTNVFELSLLFSSHIAFKWIQERIYANLKNNWPFHFTMSKSAIFHEMPLKLRWWVSQVLHQVKHLSQHETIELFHFPFYSALVVSNCWLIFIHPMWKWKMLQRTNLCQFTNAPHRIKLK